MLGFNSIYRTFREHDKLCDRYTLQLIHACVTSLSLSSEFEETSLLVRSTKRAIQHLERIVKKKKDQFNVVRICVTAHITLIAVILSVVLILIKCWFQEMRDRKKPIDLASPTLRSLVDWLKLKSADCWHACRRECFRLIEEFSPLIRGSLVDLTLEESFH